MTDRELLELAAKAIGLTLKYNYLGSRDARQPWDPLTDDGDALRLAVDLRLIVRCYEHLIFVDGGGESCEEMVFSDRSAAVRRAIVRAAASIGKDMP